MKTKHVISSKDTFNKVVSAVKKMSALIKPTYGPAGNKVIIDKQTHKLVVDDGVQIARDIVLDDPVENAIVRVVRETAITTNDRQKDGTTGAIILVDALIDIVSKKTIVNGRKIERELKQGLLEVKDQLKDVSTEIETKEDLKKVAMTAFDNEEIAEIVSDLYFDLGKEAIITLEKSDTMETVAEKVDGMELKSGYISPYMANNHENMTAVLENAHILLTDYRITEEKDILPLMNKMAEGDKKKLVIIADNVEQNALSTLIINLPHVMNPQTKQPGSFASVAIAIPKVKNKVAFLEDLAVLTGARVFSEKKGDLVANAELDDLGTAKKVIVSEDKTIIVEPGGDKKAIKEAIESLESTIKSTTKKKTIEELESRLAFFTSKTAVIKVGAPTENEQKALKYKVEDAVNSVKSAFNHGVVAGSGIALARLETTSPILNEALKYPSRQLRENMGLDEAEIGGDNIVENVVTGEIGNFLDVGVVDPVQTLLAGVESAVSIASLLITSPGILVEYVDEE